MTITASTLDGLGPTIPDDLKQVVGKAVFTLNTSFDQFSWNEMPGIFFCFGRIDKTKTVYGGASPMDSGIKSGTERTVDVLNAMALRGVPLVERCRYHVGYGTLVDGVHTTVESSHRLAGTRNGAEMSALIDDMTATGEAANWRMAVGVLVSGWSYEITRYRGKDALEINIYPVGVEPENNEIYHILRDFNDRVPKKLKKRR